MRANVNDYKDEQRAVLELWGDDVIESLDKPKGTKPFVYRGKDHHAKRASEPKRTEANRSEPKRTEPVRVHLIDGWN